MHVLQLRLMHSVWIQYHVTGWIILGAKSSIVPVVGAHEVPNHVTPRREENRPKLPPVITSCYRETGSTLQTETSLQS